MITLAIAICEDSTDDHDRLEKAIASADASCTCDWFRNGEQFLEQFVEGKYDLVFLDIFMNEITGAETAQRIREVDSEVMIAFVTSSADFAMEGYRSRVERYLLKPYRDEEVHEAIDGAMRKASTPRSNALSVAGQTIPYSRIRFLEQRNHTTIIYLSNDREIKRTGRLDEMEKSLPCPPFYRCHKSFLVNLDQVTRLDRDFNVFEMEGGGKAYIRRASMAQAKRAYEKRLIERTRELGEQVASKANLQN